MPNYHIENFGCRATQADAATIERQLLAAGCTRADSPDRADVLVLNTCTVTAAADLQARQAIVSAAKQNSATRILVTGCYAQRAPEEIAPLPGVTWVVGNSHQGDIARLALAPANSRRTHAKQTAEFVSISSLSQASLSDRAVYAADATSLDFRSKIIAGDISAITNFPTDNFAGDLISGHTRPTLKIQDGCDNRCAYCVIPFVRGRSRSMAPKAVVAEIRSLVAAGAQEIILSGINLGSYGRDLTPRVELLELLRGILDETSLARLRLSSIEPMDVTRELVEFAASTDRFAHHFHMPLQSGSDRILAAMHRWYRAEHYAEHAQLIRELLPDAAIGADIITGFPGESHEDHATTLKFVGRMPFTYLHVFSFSERPGTKAEGLQNRVSAAEIHRRAREVRALGESKHAAFRASQVGKKLRVLTLETKPRDLAQQVTRAVSGNYLDLRVRGDRPPNRWLDVCVTSAGARSAEAEPALPVAAD